MKRILLIIALMLVATCSIETSVAIKRQGKWQLVSTQATIVKQ